MTNVHESVPDSHQDTYSKTLFGFWVYLLTDFMMFAALFATYAVLHQSTYGGPSAKDLFSLPFAMSQTLLLLLCSFTSGLGGIAAHRQDRKGTLILFGLTFVLGLIFMGREWIDLARLVQAGSDWRASAFLSAFFTLVGTHGLHMVFALLWIPILLWPVWKTGVTPVSLIRLTCLRMFWQFLNVVWVFVFAIVYLMGSYGG
jgi:cytochrome o ubiquinol oxidase subunit 3